VSGRYLLRKAAQAILTIAFILLLNFLLFRMMPGSPDRVLARNMPAAAHEQLRERWGLDKPLIPDQLVAYVTATVQGDFGDSYKFRGRSVVDVLAERIWPTVLLFGTGEILAVILGLGLGAYSGWRRGGIVDYVGNGISLILYSMPYFVIGMVMLMVFSAGLRLFPTSGMYTIAASYASPLDQLVDIARHFALPLATVAIGLIGQYSILMRSSLIDTLGEDYITTARAKGLPDGVILRDHALPNALLPAVTLVAINLGYVIAGAITVEVVFGWPGIGTLTVIALNSRDYPVLQGIFLLLSVSVVVANLLADLVYSALDPRVRA
jgi:peptide/nickel transport system permease protein